MRLFDLSLSKRRTSTSSSHYAGHSFRHPLGQREGRMDFKVFTWLIQLCPGTLSLEAWLVIKPDSFSWGYSYQLCGGRPTTVMTYLESLAVIWEIACLIQLFTCFSCSHQDFSHSASFSLLVFGHSTWPALDTEFAELSAKWKCRTSCSKRIMNFKSVTEAH